MDTDKGFQIFYPATRRLHGHDIQGDADAVWRFVKCFLLAESDVEALCVAEMLRKEILIIFQLQCSPVDLLHTDALRCTGKFNLGVTWFDPCFNLYPTRGAT